MLSLLKLNLKHFFITFTILFLIIVSIGIYHGAEAIISEDRLAYKIDKEGPHIFFENNALAVSYIRGSKSEGFQNEKISYPLKGNIPVQTHFALEGQDINFEVNTTIKTPPTSYDDNQPILAISDIEGGYKTFRDFLIANNVIDNSLNWTFGKGHLVLVGDFVDRGNSVTQVLWFIYKMEQDAKKHGGNVHFIIGNHEIKNLQGNFYSASEKYLYIASILDKTQFDLYGEDSFLGKWLSSKNSIERINGRLFVHGGIHPKIGELDYTLDEINKVIRKNYRKPYFTKPNREDDDFLVSSKTGPAWYRGYFKDNLTQEEVEKGLNKFSATAVIVGHTLQWSVNKLYQGKVFAIDVKHPNDYRTGFPIRSSEGLLIEDDKFYRLLDDGTQEIL